MIQINLPPPDRTGATKIICGDCLNQLKSLPTNTMDCIVTSPPYYRHVDYGWAGQSGLETTLNDYIQYQKQVARELRRIAKHTANLFWVVRDTFNKSGSSGGDHRNPDGSYRMRVTGPREIGPAQQQLLVPERTRLAFADVGWLPIMNITRPLGNGRGQGNRRPCYSEEHILLFASSPQRFWNRDAALDDGKQLNGVWHIQRSDPPVISLDGKLVRGQATFPLILAQTCLALGCPSDGLVLDPYCGTGTSLIAAATLGLDSLGIEGNPETVRFAEERCSAHNLPTRLVSG